MSLQEEEETLKLVLPTEDTLREDIAGEASGGTSPEDTLTLDFWLPQNGRNGSLLFQPLSVVFGHAAWEDQDTVSPSPIWGPG